jgi:NADH-quinone oxidoreductase subunit C
MSGEEIHRILKEKFGEKIGELKDGAQPSIEIDKEIIRELGKFLKEDSRFLFDHLVYITATDERTKIKVIWCLFSYTCKHYLVLKADLDRSNPEVDTVSDIWATAEWHERETYDFFGINFKGHPDLRRILLPDDWEGYPLRKDYTPPDFYHGIDNRYKR